MEFSTTLLDSLILTDKFKQRLTSDTDCNYIKRVMTLSGLKLMTPGLLIDESISWAAEAIESRNVNLKYKPINL